MFKSLSSFYFYFLFYHWQQSIKKKPLITSADNKINFFTYSAAVRTAIFYLSIGKLLEYQNGLNMFVSFDHCYKGWLDDIGELERYTLKSFVNIFNIIGKLNSSHVSLTLLL